MAGAVKGITVEIGGNTTKLGAALAEVNTKTKGLQQELKGVNTLLKLDPNNVTLLKQKQDLLNASITETKAKLETLKSAEAQVQAQFERGDITEEQFRDFQREIVATEEKLKGLNNELKDFGSVGAQQIANTGEKLKTFGAGMTEAGKAMMPVTLAIGGMGVASVKTAADFDSSMSQVAATMGMTADEINAGSEDFEKLSEAARAMGASTMFSASDAADALNYLALAGYDTDKAIETLPTVLNLAAAGGIELASASDMVTDAMSALGPMAGTANEFVDKMAKTSQKSNTNVAQLGEAILTLGGTAKNLAGGTTEMNTCLGILADNSVKGSEGGTALRNIILSLSAPTDVAAGKMKELGLNVYDAEGKMRPMNDIFKDLNGTLSTMTQGEQTQVLNEIFNKVDLKSVNALLANCGDRFDELSGDINNSDGAAQAMADAMQNNLNGQLTTLSSALKEAAISVGTALMPAMKGLVEIIQGLVEKFNALSPTAQTVIVVIAAIVAAIGPALIIIGQIATGIGALMTFAPTIVAGIGVIKGAVMGLTATMMANPIILIITAIVAVVILLYTKCEWFRNGVNAVITAVIGFFSNFGTNVKNIFTKVINAVVTFATNFKDNFKNAATKAIDAFLNFFKDLPGKLWNGLIQLIVKVEMFKIQIIAKMIDAAIHLCSALIDGIKALPGKLLTLLLNVAQKVETFKANAKAKMIAAAAAIGTALINGLKSLPGKLIEVGTNLVKGIWNGINNATQWIIDKIKGFGEAVLNGLKAFFNIQSPSRVMRDQIGKNLALGVAAGIEENTDEAVKAAEEMAQKILDSAKDRIDKYQTYREMSLSDEVDYWNSVRKMIETGTDARYEADKNYLDKKKDLDDKLLAADTTYQENVAGVYDKLTTDINSLTKTYNDAITSRTNAITSSMSLFEAFAADEETTSEQLMTNLQSQVDGLSDWKDQLDKLRSKGVSEDFIDELENMGVKSVSELQALNDMTGSQLNEYVGLWKKKNELARQEATAENEKLKTETIDQIKSLTDEANKSIGDYFASYGATYKELGAILEQPITALTATVGQNGQVVVSTFTAGIKDGALSSETSETLSSLNDTVTEKFAQMEPEAQDIGENVADGLAKGIENGQSGIISAAIRVVQAAIAAAREEADIHSPSRVMAKLVGRPLAEGVGVGIEEASDVPAKAMQQTVDASALYGSNITRGIDNTFAGNTQATSLSDVLTLLSSYMPRLIEASSHELVLDSGAVVGGTINQIDAKLGQNALLKARRV